MDRSGKQSERRIMSDRRKFTYTAYSPERRRGYDRRRNALEQIKVA